MEAFPAGDADGVQPALSFAGEGEQVGATVVGIGTAFDEAQLFQHLHLAADGGLTTPIWGKLADLTSKKVLGSN